MESLSLIVSVVRQVVVYNVNLVIYQYVFFQYQGYKSKNLEYSSVYEIRCSDDLMMGGAHLTRDFVAIKKPRYFYRGIFNS